MHLNRRMLLSCVLVRVATEVTLATDGFDIAREIRLAICVPFGRRFLEARCHALLSKVSCWSALADRGDDDAFAERVLP